MIAKQVQGSNFGKVLNYVHHKSGARLIGSNMVGQDPESLANEFQIASDLRKRVTKCVYHASLSVSPSEQLSDRRWVEISRAYLKGMEFNGSQYAIYRHTDTEHDHIHIIANRIKITDGSVVSDSWQYRRAEVLVRQLEEQFGLFATPCSWNKGKRSPTTGEIRKERRTGEVSSRSQLQIFIQQALNESLSLDEFIEHLSAKDISVRLRKSNEGKIEGISYKLNGVAFQGRQLGRDYSWTSLEANFATKMTDPEIVRSRPNENSKERIRVEAQVSFMPNEAAKPSEDELEPRKMQLRAKYINFATQVRDLPQFSNKENEDIDIGVALLSLKSGHTLEEAKMILTQSDTVRHWHQEFSQDRFLNVAKQYIKQIAEGAVDVLQKYNPRENCL
ncbi:relaxase [Aphanothece hegewaldii CCALA 016]|uniref:Relaxase n=1 Tax=Aphanothece hegewaldii CCALA 016 TaxID=2107694 RepID=A0A2T1LT63_9CHRO|nr:relaxase/mobilization nuclease domain-containing protein [Aphanothece hegewaldii]PSF33344.1 relaxase [Aphanothece hegewaldii CCALA 016]